MKRCAAISSEGNEGKMHEVNDLLVKSVTAVNIQDCENNFYLLIFMWFCCQ